MNQYIPVTKRSKKEQRRINNQARVLWTRSPITRCTENGKAYNRKRLGKIEIDNI